MGRLTPTPTGGSRRESDAPIPPDSRGHGPPPDEGKERAAFAPGDSGGLPLEDSALSRALWRLSFLDSLDGNRPGREAPLSARETTALPTTGPATMPEVGGEFLGFRLIGELGRGAFGRVYLARQGDLAS